MSEINRGFNHVNPIQNYKHRSLGMAEYKSSVIRCEDCPADKVCKKIGNFRPSCDPKSSKKPSEDEIREKCIAGTNILLDRLIEILSRKGS